MLYLHQMKQTLSKICHSLMLMSSLVVSLCEMICNLPWLLKKTDTLGKFYVTYSAQYVCNRIVSAQPGMYHKADLFGTTK